MSAGIEVKEFKYIPGQNDAEYIKLLEENSERWKQIANSAVAKLKRMSAERPEIIRCHECKHNPIKEWFGCPMAHLNERQRPEDAWCWRGEREAE